MKNKRNRGGGFSRFRQMLPADSAAKRRQVAAMGGAAARRNRLRRQFLYLHAQFKSERRHSKAWNALLAQLTALGKRMDSLGG